MAAPTGRVRYCHPGPGFAQPLVEMDSEHHKSALLYCLPLSSRMSLSDIVAFRLGMINPLLCVPLNRGGVSGFIIVAHEKQGSLLPNPVSTFVFVLGGGVACPCACLLFCMGHRWHFGPAGLCL